MFFQNVDTHLFNRLSSCAKNYLSIFQGKDIVNKKDKNPEQLCPDEINKKERNNSDRFMQQII